MPERKAGVSQNQFGRVERTDEVFSLGQVESSLASDGGIHHCQQGRRHGDPINAAHIRGCGKTCEVADHAAAEGDDRAFAVESVFEEGFPQARDRFEIFMFFASGNDD